MKHLNKNRIVIIGGGQWATVIASCFKPEIDVKMWTIENDVANNINTNHHNNKYISNLKLHNNVTATTNLDEALLFSNIVFLAIPSTVIEKNFGTWKPKLIDSHCQLIINCSKGLINGQFPYQYLAMQFHHQVTNNLMNIGSFIGAGFAKFAAISKISISLACSKREVLNSLKTMFISTLHLETSFYPQVVEIAAIMKNIAAIAFGYMSGKNFNINSLSTFFSIAIREYVALSANILKKSTNNLPNIREYLLTSIFSDFYLTCCDQTSRNFSFGKYLADNNSIQSFFKKFPKITIEGYQNAISINTIFSKILGKYPFYELIGNFLSGNINNQKFFYHLKNDDFSVDNMDI